MALTIQNYLQPGSYSNIVLNSTAATTTGEPVVAIVGPALRGPYSPQLFTNPSDSQAMYGYATKSNPLPLAIQFAFLNGAPQVLAVNVEPDNSTPAHLSIALNTLPTSAYQAAPPSAIDAVTQQLINQTGSVAATFYMQDFNPVVADPVANSTPLATQQTFANAGSTSMLQYIKLLGATQVPLANTQPAQIVVYNVETSNPPASSITQGSWNQYLNALALMNAFNGSYQSPVNAYILVPDSGQTTASPLVGYSDIYDVISQILDNVAQGQAGYTINAGGGGSQVLATEAQAYQYALNNGGILYVEALQAGTQHQVVFGLFDSNSASQSSTNTQGLGLPVQNGSLNNPFGQLLAGADGVITNNSYINALSQLDSQRADFLVVLNTDPGVQSAIKANVTTQSSHDYRNERIAFVSGPISETSLTTIQNVTALQGGPGAKRMIYIYPTAAYYFDVQLNTTVAVDGTYLGAACAGMAAAVSPSTPLTHKVLSGFTDVAVHLTNPAANAIAQYGVWIIENNPNFGLRVRHQLTCDVSTIENQEFSIVRQLDYTAQLLRDLMDANIIATAITASTLATVTSLVTNALQTLVNSKIIYGFQNIVARINPNNPTRIDLSVQVRPAYPCNYVEITLYVTSDLAGF